ncbi:MAG: sigma-70 family RNA polymerase sigma factor [Acidobacteria bacterium]|nr:sigma-70 family RNA polymerase sigma factor [Acidobacteriota bacterium]MBV9476085.1 sigma-70 family RNA polymerase sigma factor [Acidobacteriota bacterium]
MAEVASFPAREREQDASPPVRGEQKLLADIRAGDTAAAEELVERTYSAVFASIFRLCGDRDLAADLTQETYQKAWAALSGFDGRSQLFTWLYRIAYTTFLNHIRRPRRMTSLDEPDAIDVRDERPAADELLADAEEAERLREAVMKLSDDLRFTVTAHFWGGLPVKEIARIENITTVAIRKRLHRAFSLLETLLDEEVLS